MTPDEPTYPHDRYGLIHRQAALDAGFTDGIIRADVRDGRLRRLAAGTYTPITPTDAGDKAQAAADRIEQFRLRGIAVATGWRCPGATVLSHHSAAALHGLPMLAPPLTRVHLTNGEIGGGHVRRSTHVHAAELPDGDVTEVDGIPVTSLARTAADVAQWTTSTHPMAFAKALVVFDAALARGEIAEALALQLNRRRRRGTRAARSALEHANGLAESVGESWGRAQMIVAGLPVPTLQVEHHVAGQVYRVDGDWSGKLVWEFDGMVKYGGHLRQGETAADAVIREKVREDALRRSGVMVVRSWWSMLERGTLVPMLADWLDHFGLR